MTALRWQLPPVYTCSHCGTVALGHVVFASFGERSNALPQGWARYYDPAKEDYGYTCAGKCRELLMADAGEGAAP